MMKYVNFNIKCLLRTRLRLTFALCLCFLAALPCTGFAREEIRAAVAANYILPFGETAALFEASTGIHVEPVFSSSGKLNAQIVEGAPYDLFLSADDKRPEELFRKGLATKPFVYARGEVVLWTSRSELCAAGDWKAILSKADVKKISIANVETAPYGTASMLALKKAGMWEGLQPRLVFPQDIAQAFQYAFTGSVDAGFCALSSALSEQGKKGCFVQVNDAPEVVQAACVLTRSTRKEAAEKFAAFLLSDQAQAVKRKYGYK
jgi:molybdate transport system substrate-binding protein